MHYTMRGHQKSVQIPRSIVISQKDVTLGAVLLTTEKGRVNGIVKLSFSTTNIAAYVNKVYVCLFVTNYMWCF